MATQPENSRIQAVSRLLPQSIYREKMHNPYRGGTPDMWYSGKGGDLWVEWKWIPKIPKLPSTMVVPDLSKLQLLWIEGRAAEGRNVCVIVGCPEGNVSFGPASLRKGYTAETFRSNLVSNKDTAAMIARTCG